MSTVNVFRYAALVAGVAYGISTDRSLACAAQKKAEDAKFAKQTALISEAKAEYAKLHAPKPAAAGEGVAFNLDDDKLDFAKAIDSAIASLE